MRERSYICHIAGHWVRAYIGSTGAPGRRARRWASQTGMRGAYIVPWRCQSSLGPAGRVFGLQWRPERKDGS